MYTTDEKYYMEKYLAEKNLREKVERQLMQLEENPVQRDMRLLEEAKVEKKRHFNLVHKVVALFVVSLNGIVVPIEWAAHSSTWFIPVIASFIVCTVGIGLFGFIVMELLYIGTKGFRE